jgi:hypothetical protein
MFGRRTALQVIRTNNLPCLLRNLPAAVRFTHSCLHATNAQHRNMLLAWGACYTIAMPHSSAPTISPRCWYFGKVVRQMLRAFAFSAWYLSRRREYLVHAVHSSFALPGVTTTCTNFNPQGHLPDSLVRHRDGKVEASCLRHCPFATRNGWFV